MATKSKRKTHRKKTASKKKYRQCRSTEKLPPGWFTPIAPIDNARPYQLQTAYKNLQKLAHCRDFKREAIPCRYLPKAKVSTYAALCNIRGRSRMSQKALCSSLMRRTKTKPVSAKCADRRMMELIKRRDAIGLSTKDIPAKAMRNVIRSAKMKLPRHATKAQMIALIRDMKTQSKAQLKQMKQASKQKVNAMASAGYPKPVIQEVKQSDAAAIAAQAAAHQADLMEAKYELKSTEDVDDELDENDLDERWFESTTFDDLLALNVEFINGKLPMTPYHFGKLETDDKTFIHKLTKLHEYGALTHDGQDPSCTYGEYVKAGPYYVDEERRGYLDFYVDLVDNSNLAFSLLTQIKQSGLIYTIYDFHADENISNIPKGETFTLTQERSSPTKEDLAGTKWNAHTRMPSVIDSKYLLWHEKEIDPILKHTMHFAVALPDYCKGDLESMILDMCKRAGNAKKYSLKWGK